MAGVQLVIPTVFAFATYRQRALRAERERDHYRRMWRDAYDELHSPRPVERHTADQRNRAWERIEELERGVFDALRQRGLPVGEDPVRTAARKLVELEEVDQMGIKFMPFLEYQRALTGIYEAMAKPAPAHLTFAECRALLWRDQPATHRRPQDEMKLLDSARAKLESLREGMVSGESPERGSDPS